jgi:hypothetical protein
MNRWKIGALAWGLVMGCGILALGAEERTAWYRQSAVNVHFDNHSGLLGQDVSAEQLTAMMAGLPVTMLQVSAQSNGFATYATQVGLNNPAAQGYDTLATFKRLTAQQGKKLCIYMSVDRRPLDLKDHPEWAAIDAAGQPEVNGEPIVCQRPNRQQRGYLYERFLPQIREIIRRYDPDGFWFDGDYVLRRPCWCANCLREWQAETGLAAPHKAGDPNWDRWISWHAVRYHGYLQAVADAIHRASPKAMYTSNWSWAWTPEPAPVFADTLSGDAWNVGQVHAVVQRWGAQRTPWDVMSYCTPAARALATRDAKHAYSLQRTLQEGALTMGAGGVWFVWSFNGSEVPSYGVDLTRCCAQYVRDRQPALGPSVSLSQVAVLDSETTWRAGGESGVGSRVHCTARSLAEAHYLTDIVNEQTFREASHRYAVVIVPEHRTVAAETLAGLRQFVDRGGLLLLAGGALRGAGEEPAAVAALLGARRTPPADKRPQRLVIGRQCWPAVDVWGVEPAAARVLARSADGRPILCTHKVGRGAVAYLATSSLRYPDEGLMAAVLAALGRGPSYQVSGVDQAAVLCTLRGKPGQVVLHVADLSTRVDGTLVDVNSPAYTDLNPPLQNVTVALPLPAAPARVRAWPAGTLVTTEYQAGRLSVRIAALQTHAAVVLDLEVPTPLGLLPPETPVRAGNFHPSDDGAGRLLSADFEATRVGREPGRPWAAENRGGTQIVVTDQAVAGGRRALKLIDVAGSQFWPFLHAPIGPLHHGAARLAFDLRTEPGVECLIEARHEGKGAGPSVRVDGTGNVLAGGKRLTQAPPGAWHHFELEFSVDGDRPGYRFTLLTPGRPRQTFDALPLASEWFFLCNSVYFVGSGERPGAFYLDNVVVERVPSAR